MSAKTPSTQGSAAPRTQRDPEGTHCKILGAATDEFTRHGYSGARVERISACANSVDRMLNWQTSPYILTPQSSAARS